MTAVAAVAGARRIGGCVCRDMAFRRGEVTQRREGPVRRRTRTQVRPGRVPSAELAASREALTAVLDGETTIHRRGPAVRAGKHPANCRPERTMEDLTPVARTHLAVRHLPVLSPRTRDQPAGWVFESFYTVGDSGPFARDLGYDDPSHRSGASSCAARSPQRSSIPTASNATTSTTSWMIVRRDEQARSVYRTKRVILEIRRAGRCNCDRPSYRLRLDPQRRRVSQPSQPLAARGVSIPHKTVPSTYSDLDAGMRGSHWTVSGHFDR